MYCVLCIVYNLFETLKHLRFGYVVEKTIAISVFSKQYSKSYYPVGNPAGGSPFLLKTLTKVGVTTFNAGK